MLGVQVLGVVSVAAYVAVVITIVFLVIQHTVGLRAEPADELAGLDIAEHGLLTAYAGYAMQPDTVPEERIRPGAGDRQRTHRRGGPGEEDARCSLARRPNSPKWRSSARSPGLRR